MSTFSHRYSNQHLCKLIEDMMRLCEKLLEVCSKPVEAVGKPTTMDKVCRGLARLTSDK